MSPFERTPTHRIITSTVAWTLLSATLLLTMLLISTAGDISHQTDGTVTTLGLFAITKTPLADGTTVSMVAMPGLFLYAVGAVIVAGVLSAIRIRAGKHRE